MDGSRFDALTRSFTAAGSRRGTLSALLVTSLGLLGWNGPTPVQAHDLFKKCKKIQDKNKRKKCVKKAKKHKAQHTTQVTACSTGLPRCAGNCCPAALVNASAECGEGFDENGNPGFGCTYTCDPGWEDCDGIIENGCETHVAIDPNNCGICERPCGTGQTCCQCLCGTEGGDNCVTCNSIRRARLIRV
jgi:hypothetical protein